MKGQIKLYLGGTMSYYYLTHQFKKATKWRVKLARKLFEINNDLGERHFDWFDPTLNFEDNYKTANNKTIVHQNELYLDNCDILIINLNELEKSPGTIYELYYYKNHNKPIIAFGESNWVNSPHVAESITIQLKNINEIANYLMNYYCQ